MNNSLTENCGCCVLCAASHPGRSDLRVLRPGVFIAEQSVEVINHMRRFLEDPFRIFHVLLIDPVGDWKRAKRILYDSKRTDSQHEEIGGMGKLL
ncbi:hypothetical protein ES703_83312 [subsurface metagenome]